MPIVILVSYFQSEFIKPWIFPWAKLMTTIRYATPF